MIGIIVFIWVIAFAIGNVTLFYGGADDTFELIPMIIAIISDAAIIISVLKLLSDHCKNQAKMKYDKKREIYLNKIKTLIDNNNKQRSKIVTNINDVIKENDLINKLLELCEIVSDEQSDVRAYCDQSSKNKYDSVKEQIKAINNKSKIDRYPSTYDGINEYRQMELDNISSNDRIFERLSAPETKLSEIKREYKKISRKYESRREHFKRTARKIICSVISCFFIIIPIAIYGFTTMQWYDSVESYVYKLVSRNIAKYSLKVDSYFYMSGLDTDFEILRIDYYKHNNLIEVVPQLVFHADDKYVSSDEGSVVLREICDQFSGSLKDIPENVCIFGSVHFIANGTIMESDGSYVYVDRYKKYLNNTLYNRDSKKFIPYSYLLIPLLIYIFIVFSIFKSKIRKIEEE